MPFKRPLSDSQMNYWSKRRRAHRRQLSSFRRSSFRGSSFRRRRPRKARLYNSVRIKPLIAPDRVFVKLKNTKMIVTHSGKTTGFNDSRMWGNSLHRSTIGNAMFPAGIEAWDSFYNKYIVLATKVKLHFFHNDSFICKCQVRPTQVSTATTSTTENDERQYTRQRVLPGVNSGGNSNKAIINAYMSSKRMFQNKDLMGDEDQWTTMGANPTHGWYWHIVSDTSEDNEWTEGTSLKYIQIYVECTYYCVFKRVAQGVQ